MQQAIILSVIGLGLCLPIAVLAWFKLIDEIAAIFYQLKKHKKETR